MINPTVPNTTPATAPVSGTQQPSRARRGLAAEADPGVPTDAFQALLSATPQQAPAAAALQQAPSAGGPTKSQILEQALAASSGVAPKSPQTTASSTPARAPAVTTPLTEGAPPTASTAPAAPSAREAILASAVHAPAPQFSQASQPRAVPSWLSGLGSDLRTGPQRAQSAPIDLNELSAFEAAEDPFAGSLGAAGATVESVSAEPRNALPAGASGWGGAEYLGVLGATRAAGSSRHNAMDSRSDGEAFGSARKDPASLAGAAAPLKKKLPHESALVFNPADALGARDAQAPAALRFSPGAVPMRGDVIPGANAEERLAKVSVLGLSTGIRDFARNGGAGEMRLRLNPEHLGEIRLQVNSMGRDVGIKIQAADERSKRIIESSLSDLRDGLSIHQLNLGRVEVSVAQPASALASLDSQAGYLDSSSRGGNGWGERGGNSREPGFDSPREQAAPSWNAQPRSPARSYAPGRLDVVA